VDEVVCTTAPEARCLVVRGPVGRLTGVRYPGQTPPTPTALNAAAQQPTVDTRPFRHHHHRYRSGPKSSPQPFPLVPERAAMVSALRTSCPGGVSPGGWPSWGATSSSSGGALVAEVCCGRVEVVLVVCRVPVEYRFPGFGAQHRIGGISAEYRVGRIRRIGVQHWFGDGRRLVDVVVVARVGDERPGRGRGDGLPRLGRTTAGSEGCRPRRMRSGDGGRSPAYQHKRTLNPDGRNVQRLIRPAPRPP
jgi:hypothetical protein